MAALLRRFVQAIRALLGAFRRRRDDPTDAARAMLRGAEGELHEAKTTAARTAADLKRLARTRDARAHQADELAAQATGALEASREDDARAAVARETELRASIEALNDQIAALDARCADLRSNVLTLQAKLDEAKTRFRRLAVHEGVLDSEAGAREVGDDLLHDGRLGRLAALEQEMDRWEVDVEVREEIESDPTEAQVRELDRHSGQVEERLAELRRALDDASRETQAEGG